MLGGAAKTVNQMRASQFESDTVPWRESVAGGDRGIARSAALC
jgi:hypothetical protein